MATRAGQGSVSKVDDVASTESGALQGNPEAVHTLKDDPPASSEGVKGAALPDESQAAAQRQVDDERKVANKRHTEL